MGFWKVTNSLVLCEHMLHFKLPAQSLEFLEGKTYNFQLLLYTVKLSYSKVIKTIGFTSLYIAIANLLFSLTRLHILLFEASIIKIHSFEILNNWIVI